MSSQSFVPRISQLPEWFARSVTFRHVRLTWLERSVLLSLAKYVFDVTLCLLALPIALPLMGIVALTILRDTGWPVVFVQERIGRGGRRFRMFKFRTLRKDYRDATDREFMKSYIKGNLNRNNGSTNNGAGKEVVHKPFQATEITRVGRILRRTSLDELPQIFNVLRGEMSLVGPRPHVPWEVEDYRGWHTERLEVLPGITGLAQVRGRSGIAFDTMARCDIEYVRRKSLWLDIKILWWTVASLLSGRGAG